MKSVPDVSAGLTKPSGAGSRLFPARIPEEDRVFDGEVDDDYKSQIPTKNGNDRIDSIAIWPENATPMEYDGEGFGKGNNDGEKSKIGDYHRELLKSNSRDSLVLRNYGKFMQEVEKDTEKAEEYYGRAILANPGDGEVLSMYGNLIWMTQGDEERAKSYLDQAVIASPNDSEELMARLRKLAERAERNEYRELVKDIVPNNDANEPFSSYRDQLGFGLHVVIMFTCYLVGYATFRALFSHSPIMSAAGGILGLVCGMLVETFLFIIRSSSWDARSPSPASTFSRHGLFYVGEEGEDADDTFVLIGDYEVRGLKMWSWCLFQTKWKLSGMYSKGYMCNFIS